MYIEPIATALAHAGISLTFDSFDILGIPGFNTSILYKGEVSLYEVERQNFNFQISTVDAIENLVTIDSEFTIEDSGYLYRFKLDRPPTNDLTGWSKLNVNLISVSLS